MIVDLRLLGLLIVLSLPGVVLVWKFLVAFVQGWRVSWRHRDGRKGRP